MNLRNGCELGLEAAVDLVLQFGVVVVGQGTTELGLHLEIGLPHGSAEETLENLLRRNRIAVARQRRGMRAAGNDLAVDEHAVAIEDDEIDCHRVARALK